MNTGFRSGEPVCLILAILEQSIQTLSHFLIYLCCTQVSLIPDLCLTGLCCSHGYRTKSWTVPTLLLLLGKGSLSAHPLSPSLAWCHGAADSSASMCVESSGCVSGQWIENGLPPLPQNMLFKTAVTHMTFLRREVEGAWLSTGLENIGQLVRKCIQYPLCFHACLIPFFSWLPWITHFRS